jgi:hypothetical protein
MCETRVSGWNVEQVRAYLIRQGIGQHVRVDETDDPYVVEIFDPEIRQKVKAAITFSELAGR